ncbi:molecular chaperone DnaJ [Novosphingobium sp.]|uniref:molecular chaperone DnaJ n=1 Tax=Novosphingobium sp. TaxID=1874826 RepID=UPI0035AE7F22
MVRWFIYLAIAAFVLRQLTGQWPWQLWANSERSQAEAQARALLGIGREARREEIIEAHRRQIARVHPDRGGSNEAVHAANAARDLLIARIERQELERK